MPRGNDKKRPLRDMGKNWRKMTLVTTSDTMDWIESEAAARETSRTAFVDDLVTKAKWAARSRTQADKI